MVLLQSQLTNINLGNDVCTPQLGLLCNFRSLKKSTKPPKSRGNS